MSRVSDFTKPDPSFFATKFEISCGPEDEEYFSRHGFDFNPV